MFTLEAIILKIHKIRENQTRVILLTREYGKITAWWNKKNISGVDIGDIVEVHIKRDSSVNRITSLHTKYPSWNQSWQYDEIYAFLSTLQIIDLLAPEGLPATELYDDSRSYIDHGRIQIHTICHTTLFQMRILKGSGYMEKSKIEHDPMLRTIYHSISKTPLDRILSTTRIEKNHIAIISDINLHSIHLLTH